MEGMTMREILFRGKRKDTGEWLQGDLIHSQYKLGDTCVGQYGNTVGIHQVDPETVGQFTGLIDKNGKKIFEGDIIKIPDDYDEFGINAGEVYEVYFAFGGFRLKPKRSNAKGFWLEDDKTVEIIGNIHDNPELLNGGNENE
jgi:uncharacterized phage protein (TIGR01671 family)